MDMDICKQLRDIADAMEKPDLKIPQIDIREAWRLLKRYLRPGFSVEIIMTDCGDDASTVCKIWDGSRFWKSPSLMVAVMEAAVTTCPFYVPTEEALAAAEAVLAPAMSDEMFDPNL